jgi:pyruvate kinase
MCARSCALLKMNANLVRRDFRHTKIVCTLGPASQSYERIRELATAGMNVARLNMSHGTYASHEAILRRIKGLNRVLNHPLATLLDLQGPEIRTGDLLTPVTLVVGELLGLTAGPIDDPELKMIDVNYADIADDVRVGDRVTLDSGLINLEVLERRERILRCRVIDGGTLGARRHVNLPGVRVKLPSITAKDRQDIAFGIQQGIDFIALSFVRSADDVREARALLDRERSAARVIAKIENHEGVENFETILEAADAIMVARGDLGVEVPLRELPVIQRRMVRACALAGKPVIVATQLLESMIKNPMPTRAEVTDVANAIYEQTDAVMLSGETSTGDYPVRSVQVLDDIARHIEKEPALGFHRERRPADAREELARSAVRLADDLESRAIVVITRRGRLAQLVARYRPKSAIIYAFTNMSSARRKLWLVRSVVPMITKLSRDPEKTVQNALDRLKARNRLLPGDPIVIVSDVMAGMKKITSIQVRHFS